MPDQPETCQVRISGGKPCGRPLYDGDKCICHSEDLGKDPKLFQQEVDEQLNRDDHHDFTGFVFSKDFDFSGREFKRDTYFNRAKFSGDASFSEATFSGKVNFYLATFSGEANFNGATFSREANFFEATYSGVAYFTDTTFSGAANFAATTFSSQAQFTWSHLTETARMRFSNLGRREPMFGKDASFVNLQIDDGAQLIFSHVGLENCRFMGTEVTKIEFTAVKWPRRRPFKWSLLVRRAVADELPPEKYSWEQVGDVYRGLQNNYQSHNRYADAGDFYVAEQDVNRKTNRRLRYLVPSWLYRLVSLYGQSYLRPLGWMAFFLLLFPAMFLWGGIGPSAATDGTQSTAKVVSYSFSLNPVDSFLFQSFGDHYWTCFFNNVSFLTFNRAKLSSQLVDPYQHALAGLEIVIMVALIAFFLLALRRQFKRKSF